MGYGYPTRGLALFRTLLYSANTLRRMVLWISLTGLIALSQLSAAAYAQAPTTCDVFDGIEVRFAPESVALSAASRESLNQEVARILLADYCPILGLLVIGHVDANEAPGSSAEKLSRERATYVARHLQLRGVPPELIRVEAKGSKEYAVKPPDPRNARVKTHVVAGCPSRTCPYPVNALGLRMAK